jgi:DNA-binding CsgD family transcriptional regulator
VLEDAVARGLLAVTERKSLSLHPLLRELLLRRFDEADAELRAALLARWRRLCEAGRWDEALCVAEAARDAAFVTEAIGAALDDLLDAGRTSSLQRWVAAARSAGAEGGLIDYAESEALLRGDELDRAMALATQAARSLDGDLAARAHLVAGRSAHLTDRPSRTGHYAELAAASAETAETREGALWLHFAQALEQQAPDLAKRLEDFRAAAGHGLKQSLMLAAGELGVALVEGGLADALDDARGVLALARTGADAIAHSSFLSTYSYALAVHARYEEGLECIDALTSLAEGSAIEFPVRYAQMNRVKTLVGLRRFTQAARTLSTLERQIRPEPGGYFGVNLTLQRARLYASVGDLERALDVLSLGPHERSTRAGRSEFLGWQALFTAVIGNSGQAQTLASNARHAGRGLEAQALSLVTEAILRLEEGKHEVAAAHLKTVIGTEVHDPIVIAVRAEPRLGAFIAEHPHWRPWFQRLLSSSRDTSLAASFGLKVPRAARGRTRLSPRESEVHELLAEGLTNEEIAKQLFISLSTTKVHVKHIFEKLGVRSRLEAARALRDDV